MSEKMDAALAAIADNDEAAARDLLREILHEDPDNELAWFWMARVATTERERRACLRQVVRINPENVAARQELGLLETPADVEEQPPDLARPPQETMDPAQMFPPMDDVWEEAKRPAWVLPLVLILLAALLILVLALMVYMVPDWLGIRPPEVVVPVTTELAATPDVNLTEEAALLVLTPGRTPGAGDGTAQPAGGTVTGEPQDVAPALVTVAPDWPNLILARVAIELERGGACDYDATQLGTTVVVENVGEGGAGPFVVDVNGTRQRVEDGLASGERISLWFEGYRQDDVTAIVVDADFEVQETSRKDNFFSEPVPVPTLPPTCTPPAEEEEPLASDDISVANAVDLAPIRITSRSVYSEDPSSFLQLEADAEGNTRLVRDVPGEFEEWYVIEGVVYAGETLDTELAPFEAVENPGEVAGFEDPFDVYGPRQEFDRFSLPFPLHAVLWPGLGSERAEKESSETVQGFAADRYRISVDPGEVPESVWIAEGRSEDLRAAIEAGEGNEFAYVWVEPESRAVVKAEWNVSFESGNRGQYSLAVAAMDLATFELPSAAGLPNPASEFCTSQGYELEIRTQDIGQVGYCLFPDGSECEEWAFYRAECAIGEEFPVAEVAPAATPGAAAEAPAPGSPQETVVDYWQLVVDGSFEEAWDLLSPKFQQARFGANYRSYARRFRNMQLCSVVANDLAVVQQGADKATVSTRLEYSKQPGCELQEVETDFFLIYDTARGLWLIDDQVLK